MREREYDCVSEREREYECVREREYDCVREREYDCVSVYVYGLTCIWDKYKRRFVLHQPISSAGWRMSSLRCHTLDTSSPPDNKRRVSY